MNLFYHLYHRHRSYHYYFVFFCNSLLVRVYAASSIIKMLWPAVKFFTLLSDV